MGILDFLFGGGSDPGQGQRRAARRETQRKSRQRQQINALFTKSAPVFAKQDNQIRSALRTKYGDELKDDYTEAERNARFNAARRGQLGGSAHADTMGLLERQSELGGTRIGEAVQRALAALRGEREDTRTRAIGLVNAGAGGQAITAANTGLRTALDNARTANREQLFTDLFADAAFSKGVMDNANRNAAALEYFQRARGLSPSSGPTSGGRTFNY